MNTHLLSRLDARLKEFISTGELPWGGGLSGSMDKPNYPSLYLSRSTDPGLMKLPGEGSAMVRYKVKRREIDESREDGQPLYGASIEIQEIEPVEEGEKAGKELENTLFLKRFSVIGDRRYFAEARDRDGEGRFAAGNVPGPQDYAIAQAMAKRKKATSMAGNIARNARGRVVM
jgi:hypothetical protein